MKVFSKSIGNKVTSAMCRIGKALEKKKGIMLVMSVAVISAMSFAFAVSAEGKWTELMNMIIPWIERLGGLVLLVGGVMFALGFKSDDAEQKSRGIGTAVAGVMVIAVCGLSSTFIW